MNARDGTPEIKGTDALCVEARALAIEAQAWGTDGHELPAKGEATRALDRLNSYGADLRDAVNVRCSELPKGSDLHLGAQVILGEADRRLGQPPLGATTEDVVRRAQNLARLVHGLLRALGAEADTAARCREPSA
ncbi:DUF6415 family natural product biosynthesis protein [Streptomyces sp. NPDC058257]|uniref:DUF6415 family natural product biosynthesis protein n=1 Tax=unclassified Streptomyces TaxID=2593676 RepID=UPI00366055EA